jgi:hypothetical protein
MRVIRVASATAAVVSCLSVGACSKSASTAPNGTPTQVQVSEMFSELSAVSASISTIGFTRAGSTSGVLRFAGLPHLAYDVSTAINATGNCPSGGTVAVSGNINPTTSGITFGFTDTWTNCQTAHFIVNGADTDNGSFSTTGGSSPTVSGSLTETGTLNVSGPVWQGTCDINITVTDSGPASSPTVSWTGQMCGVSVSGTV